MLFSRLLWEQKQIFSYKRDKYENESKEIYKDWLIEGVGRYSYIYIHNNKRKHKVMLLQYILYTPEVTVVTAITVITDYLTAIYTG